MDLAGFNLELPRTQAFESLLTTDTGLKLAGAANGIMLNSIADAQALVGRATGVTISTTFPNTNLGNQLKQVATIIKARENWACSGRFSSAHWAVSIRTPARSKHLTFFIHN